MKLLPFLAGFFLMLHAFEDDEQMETLAEPRTKQLENRIGNYGYSLKWGESGRRKVAFAVQDNVTVGVGVGYTKTAALRDLDAKLTDMRWRNDGRRLW